MSKHAPGPWDAVQNAWNISTIYGVDDCEIAVCRIYLDHLSEEEAEDLEDEYVAVLLANACLIAAAPNLLDVAEMVLALATIDTPPELIEAATAAIAKARGAA